MYFVFKDISFNISFPNIQHCFAPLEQVVDLVVFLLTLDSSGVAAAFIPRWDKGMQSI